MGGNANQLAVKPVGMSTFGKPTGLGADAGQGAPALGSRLGAPAFSNPAGLGAAVSARITVPAILELFGGKNCGLDRFD